MGYLPASGNSSLALCGQRIECHGCFGSILGSFLAVRSLMGSEVIEQQYFIETGEAGTAEIQHASLAILFRQSNMQVIGLCYYQPWTLLTRLHMIAPLQSHRSFLFRPIR